MQQLPILSPLFLRRWSAVFMLCLVAVIACYGEDQPRKDYFFDEWEVTYGAGSPFAATEWREVANTEFYEKFTQMAQISFSHRMRGRECGAATAGYRYPSMGVYLQWMDYSHLRMRGREPMISSSRSFSYGQIASLGWVLRQTCWNGQLWSGHVKLETGPAYVFHPVYTSDGVVTLAKPWQIMVGLGWYFDREIGHDNLLSLGAHFTHMSNSGLAEHNTGINNFSLCLALAHQARPERRRCPASRALLESDGTRFRPHLYYTIVTGLGGVYYEYSQKPNGQMALMADVMYRLAPSHGLGLGIDYFHCAQPDRAGRTEYVGTAVKYDHWWGGFCFHLQAGVYLNDRRPIKWKGMSRIYENIGFKYLFLRRNHVAPFLGIYTKGSGFNAEQMTFSVGAIIQ